MQSGFVGFTFMVTEGPHGAVFPAGVKVWGGVAGRLGEKKIERQPGPDAAGPPRLC